MLGLVIDGRFHIRSLIARGGMGRVYRAEQSPLGRVCALKVVNGTLAGADPEYERRFKLEASTAAKLTHPNTVTVFDYGKTPDGIFFMAMELLEGRTLHKVLKDEGALAPERAARIASQICRSLREAHHHGVVHRDLKPANVFLVAHGDEPDFVKVLDFGLVKSLDERPEEQLTQTGIFMGSPKYMAPEQIEGQKVDARTDIYSLGVMMYEMLSGKVPFDKATSVKTLMAHVHEVPAAIGPQGALPEIPTALQELVLRCLAKNPQERPSSMEEVLTALRTAAPTGDARRSSNRVPVARSVPPAPLGPPGLVGALGSLEGPISSGPVTKPLHGEVSVGSTAAGQSGRADDTARHAAAQRNAVRGTQASWSSGDLSPVASSHAAGGSSVGLAAIGRSRRPSRSLVALLGAFAVALGGGLGLIAVHLRPTSRVLSQAATAEPSHLAVPPTSSAATPMHSAPSIASAAPVATPAPRGAPPRASTSVHSAPAPAAPGVAPPRRGGGRRLPALPHSKGDEAAESSKASSL